jgi:two-component system sensor histidine kinase YesM
VLGKNWRKTFSTTRFDKKMDLFVAFSIIAVSMVLFFSTILLLHRSTVQESIQLDVQRLAALANSIEDDLGNYKEMAIALNISDSLQQYIKTDRDANPVSYYTNATLFSDTLRFICQLDQNINFISVYNEKTEDYVFRGNIGLGGKDFKTKLQESYMQSLQFDKGITRMDYTDSFTKEGYPSVNIFFPIYSVTKLDQSYGLLCISIENRNFNELALGLVNQQKTISLVDAKGNNLVRSMARAETDWSPYIESMTAESGRFEKEGILCIYQQIPDCSLYLVQEVDSSPIGTKLIQISLIIFLIMIVLIFLSLWLSRKLVKTAYAPMETVLHAMRQVKNHDTLELRIDDNRFGEDFVQIAQGFNAMMNEINFLIVQVEEEQKLKEKMRYYALQTQITPHFLYNTLECIHWQALADGNRKISALVMALGSFYKIGLSEGKEMISLGKEIEHVQNYLVIQTMRYGNIIESSFSVDPSFFPVSIPRITLQPLVENAIYHGIRVKQGKAGLVSIKAYAQDNMLIIEVSDTGGISDEEIKKMNRSIDLADDTYGFGIRNVHQRIKLGFGSAYGLSFSKNLEGGLTVIIRLPLHEDLDCV